MVDYMLLFASVVMALFAPIPVIVYEAIIALLLLVIVGFLCLDLKKDLQVALSKYIILFCLILPAVSLGLTKQFIAENLMNAFPSVIAFLASEIHGGWWMPEAFATVFFLSVDYYFVRKTNRMFEIQVRFECDTMNSKIFDVKCSLNNNEISEDEAVKRRKAVYDKVDDVFLIFRASNSLLNMVKTTVAIAVLNFAWVFIHGSLLNKLPIIEAIQLYMPYVCMNIIVLIIPQIVIECAMIFCIPYHCLIDCFS